MNHKLFCSIVIAFVELFVTNQLQAGCNHLFRHHHHVQQVVAVAPVHPLYFAGQATQDEALLRKAIRAEAPAIIQGVLQQLQAPQAQQHATNPQQAVGSLLAAKCAKCHTGENSLTNPDGTLDCSKFRSFARMAGLGLDIPEQMRPVINSLTPDEKGRLTEELLAIPPAKPEPQVLAPDPFDSPMPGVLR